MSEIPGVADGYVPGSDPSTGGLCSPWLNADELREAGCCSAVTDDTPDDVISVAIDAASEYLNAAVQFQFPGTCSATVRPCSGEDGPFGFGGLFAFSQIPFYFPDGVFPLWWLGCGCGGGCDCCGPPAFSLGHIPVISVTEVKLDGVVLEEDVDYVLAGDLLARLGHDNTWPACQNIALPDTELGTMSVTFTWGANPPTLGVQAARDLACAIIKDCGDDCKPSERMVSRQAGGTTVQLISPDGDVRTSMPRSVKMFVDSYGPPSPSMRTFPKVRRPGTGSGLILAPIDYGYGGYARAGFGSGCNGC